MRQGFNSVAHHARRVHKIPDRHTAIKSAIQIQCACAIPPDASIAAAAITHSITGTNSSARLTTPSARGCEKAQQRIDAP